MSNFEIHELTEKAINRNSNIIHDTLYGEDYETGKNLAGAVADLASANVAAPYDTTVTYAIGQYCLYEGNIYRCIAITTGAFDSTAWTQIVVSGEFRRVVELTSAQYAQLTPAEQNNGTIYIKTDEETTAADIPYSAGVSVADKIDDMTIYSTNEKAVGTWINGETVYEKVVTSTITATANSQINIAHNITNLGTIINAFVNADFGGGTNLPIPTLSMNAQGFYAYNSVALTGITATDIGLWFGRDRTVTVIAVLRYTKSV